MALIRASGTCYGLIEGILRGRKGEGGGEGGRERERSLLQIVMGRKEIVGMGKGSCDRRNKDRENSCLQINMGMRETGYGARMELI